MKIRKVVRHAAVSLRTRAMIGAGACAIASALALAGGAAPAQAAVRCTWGGTPDNPTGTIQFVGDRGATVTPSPTATRFVAKGIVEGGGPCRGQMVTFDGQSNAGSSCEEASFGGRVIGLPGVASLWGYALVNVVHEFDYDQNGNLVGFDQAIVSAPKNDLVGGALSALNCGTPQGFKSGYFSGQFELSR